MKNIIINDIITTASLMALIAVLLFFFLFQYQPTPKSQPKLLKPSVKRTPRNEREETLNNVSIEQLSCPAVYWGLMEILVGMDMAAEGRRKIEVASCVSEYK